MDSSTLTLHLPAHHLSRLREELTLLQPRNKRFSITKWHQLLGEFLHSMSPALPRTRGLFSVLQAALSKDDRRHVQDTAADFAVLVDSLAARPTRLQELVPTSPAAIGASDASGLGLGMVGGVACGSTPAVHTHPLSGANVSPLSSVHSWSATTSRNVTGTLSISDLELTAILAHKDVLVAQHRNIRERTI